MNVLTHALERTVTIRATPDVVFRFFTDSGRWASWWGAESSIDATPGGAVRIRYPDGTEASGEVLDIVPPELIVFTYGYAKGSPIAPGASRVTIHLERHDEGTLLRLTHEFADPAVRDQHVQGWRYQLSVFSNIVANEVNAGATDAVDRWFSAWAMADEDERQQTLLAIASPDVRFRDRFSAVDGIAELVPHVGAALRFMPGMRLRRNGGVRHCQGMVLADWIAVGPDGAPRASGTNLFVFGPTGRLTSVTGFWN
jgi:uncharacterized protein YndB with AHSA1/START domain